MITLDQVDALVTDAVRQEYWERGYWISPQLIDDDQIARLRAAHDRLWARDYDHDIPSQYGVPNPDLSTPVVRQFLNAFWVNDEIRAAVTSPVVGKIAARLMSVDSVRLWHDQAIYKPGTAGQAVTNVGNIGNIAPPGMPSGVLPDRMPCCLRCWQPESVQAMKF